MSKKANPTTIGLFIVIGLALGVAGLILFSSGKLFSKRERFILYFDASLKGLGVGAPVTMRGVTIGQVVEVLIHHNQAKNDFAMPVIIEIDQTLVQARTDREVNLREQDQFKSLIEQGMRARLDSQSLVTGVLYVELDRVTNAPAPHYHQLTPEYTEIPTMPTDIQELLANLARLDIGGISAKLHALLTRVDTSLSQLQMGQINDGVTRLLGSAERVIGSPDLTNSLAELKLVLTDARGLVRRLDARINPLADGLTNTIHHADQTLADLRRGLQSLSGMVEPDAPLRAELASALDSLGRAARAMTDLAEFLQRNPNALLTGRKHAEAKP